MISFPTDFTSFLAEPKEGPSNEMMSKAKMIVLKMTLKKAAEKLVLS